MKNLNDYSVGDLVTYQGESCMVVNVLGSNTDYVELVVVPMEVIDDECIGIGLDELEDK